MTKGVKLEVAQAAKKRATDVFSTIVGEEVAVGLTRIDDEGFGLKVNLDHEPADNLNMPCEVDGVPVQLEVVGKIKKLEPEPDKEDGEPAEEEKD